MTNKELSQAIRTALKEAGFQRKDISVNVKYAGYETAANITVKSPFVRLSEIEAVVYKFKEVDRDERTGEILAGGNIFVFCRYEDSIFHEMIVPLIPIAETVYNNSKWNGRKSAENTEKEVHIVQIDDTESRLYEYIKEELKTSGKSYIIRCPEALAEAIWRFKNLGTIYA